MPKFPTVVILEDIRSALNVGAIFRTCDGAGVSKLYLCGITPYPPHNRIPKTALGAIEYVEWERVADTQEVIRKLKADGYQVIAVEQTNTSLVYTKCKLEDKVAFIFGNEISGVKQETLNNVDSVVELPMYGQKNSLNVATTVGIISYYAASQYDQ